MLYRTEQNAQQAGGSQGSTGTSGKPRSEKDHKRKKKSKGKPASNTKEPEQQRLAIVEEAKKNASEPSSTPQPTNPAVVSMETCQQATPEGRAPCDSKALQMAALTHALSCIKKFRDQDLGMPYTYIYIVLCIGKLALNSVFDISDLNEESGDEISADSVWTEQFEMMKDELNLKEQVFNTVCKKSLVIDLNGGIIKSMSMQPNGFGAVVSMEDGLVVYITEEISQILGYPKDMWMGRSFMDLVHPKDKMAFASQFTFSGGITFPTGGDLNLGQKGKNYFCFWWFNSA